VTNDLALKIAALVSELGKLRNEITEKPNDEHQALMRSVCTGSAAGDAMLLASAVLIETSSSPARHFFDMILFLGKAMTFLHKDAAVREVSTGEVLRMIADTSDRSDAEVKRMTNTLKELIDGVKAAVGGVAVVGGSSGSKPGSN
jgi:hypothetical protein